MTTPVESLSQFLLFPELKLEGHYTTKRGWMIVVAHSKQAMQACPRCALVASSIYDTRVVSLKDAPIRDRRVKLVVYKRRFYCKPCKRPFTELLPSVFRGCRITERLRRSILFMCRNYTNLSRVAQVAGVSGATVFRSFYEYLALEKRRHLNYPLPSKIGFDEHGFGRIPLGNFMHGQLYATVLMDLKAPRPYRLFPTKSPRTLFDAMKDLPGKENVTDVVMDFSQGYRNLSKALFATARITVDKFHALNLLTPAINRRRKHLSGDRRKNPIGSLLLLNPKKLDYFTKSTIATYLRPHDELRILYEFRKRIYGLYNCKGIARATAALESIIDDLGIYNFVRELRALRKTLLGWKEEILNYFITGLTNGPTEGFNNKAKLVKRMAYGYKNFNNYELRFLNACFN